MTVNIVEIDCKSCSVSAKVPIGALLLEVAGDGTDELVAGTVSWICDGCAELVRRSVGWEDLVSLVSAGIPLVDEEYERPEHPEQPPDGARLTLDDLLDLHSALDSASWFEELLGQVAAQRPIA